MNRKEAEKLLQNKIEDAMTQDGRAISFDQILFYVSQILEMFRGCTNPGAIVDHVEDGSPVTFGAAYRIALNGGDGPFRAVKTARTLVQAGRDCTREEIEAFVELSKDVPIPPSSGGPMPNWVILIAAIFALGLQGVAVAAGPMPEFTEATAALMPAFNVQQTITVEPAQVPARVVQETRPSIPNVQPWIYPGPKSLREHLLEDPQHAELRKDYIAGLVTESELRQLHSAHHEHKQRGNVLSPDWFQRPATAKTVNYSYRESTQPVQAQPQYQTQRAGLFGRRIVRMRTMGSGGCPGGFCP